MPKTCQNCKIKVLNCAEQIPALSFTIHVAINLNGNRTRIHFLLVYVSLRDKRLQHDMVAVFKEQLKRRRLTSLSRWFLRKWCQNK